MAVALQRVFTTSRHRLCQWHISKKAPSKVSCFNQDKIVRTYFYQCMSKCDGEDEFERCWIEMVSRGNLQANKWLADLYTLKKKWSTVFNKDILDLDILSTQRSESANNHLHGSSKTTSTLVECFIGLENLELSWRRNEHEEDFRCKHGAVTVRFRNCYLLKHLSKLYTRKIYSLFEKSFMEGVVKVSMVDETRYDDHHIVYVTTLRDEEEKRWFVSFNSATMDAKCSCRGFETKAIPGLSGQNIHLTYQRNLNSLCHTRYPRDHCLLEVLDTHSIQGWKLAFSGTRLIQLHSLPAYHIWDRAKFYCHAATTTSDIPSSKKVNFLKLQNGSDIRGVAVEGVEGESIILTEPVSEAIGVAFAAWLLEKKKPSALKRLRVSIGHDSRISAQTLQDAISRGLATAGLDVIHYGLASTPAMFNSTISENEEFLCPVDGSIMITASHLPYNRNGFKFFTNAGGLGKTDIKDILERARNIYEKSSPEKLKITMQEVFIPFKKIGYMTVYTSDLVQAVRKAAGSIEKPLEGFHIVVDAGNGAGGFFAARVLEPLGAVTSGSQFLDPNGFFPNHIPNPEDKAAMKSIIQAVLDNQADLGIIFDTDVDRSAAVDSTGSEFNRNRLIALMSAIVLEEHPGTTIVTDSVTSDGLTTFIEKKLGGTHHRFKRGYKNVIDEAIRLNLLGQETHLAIETSGHGALKENHWLDDGAYLMVKILNKLASTRASVNGSKVLTDLIEGLEEPAVAVEVRLRIDQKHEDLQEGSFQEYGEAVLRSLENTISSDTKLVKAPINYEGVRASGHGGWLLLRLSLHDPVLPLNIEASSHEEAVKLGLSVLEAVKDFPALDTSALTKFVHIAP